MPISSAPRQVGHQAGDDVASPGVAGPLVVGHVPDDGGADGRGRVEGVGLVHRRDAQAATAGHPAGVRGDAAGEHAEQAGLSVAVSADDADAGALVDADGHRVEDHLSRILEVKGFGAQQVCHRDDPIGGSAWGAKAAGGSAALCHDVQAVGGLTQHRCRTGEQLWT